MDLVYALKDKKGKTVRATFMDQGRLEYLAPLKIDLFQAALEYSTKRDIGTARDLNHALSVFVDFLDNLTVKNSELMDLNGLNYELLFAFKKYYEKSDVPQKRVKRKLRTFFAFIKSLDLGIRVPITSRDVHTPREPLSENVLNPLISNLREEVRQIIRKQGIVDRALKTGKEIEFDKNEYRSSYTLENVCYWYMHEANEKLLKSKDREYSKLYIYLKKCSDPRVIKFSPIKFVETYHAENWRSLAAKGKRFAGKNFHQTKFDLEDVIVTMAKHPDWVLCDSRFDTWNFESLDNAWEAVAFRIARSKHPSDSVYPEVISDFTGGVPELTSIVFPSLTEAITLFTFICIQTGWNPEVLARIDRLNSEHPLSRSVDPEQALLVSKKQKSQNHANTNVLVEKEICAPSNLRDMYSAVSLLELYNKRTELLRESTAAKKAIEESEVLNPVFVYCSKNNAGVIEPGMKKGSYRTLCKKIQDFDLALDDGSRLDALDLTKIRPTWLETQISRGANESFLSMLMGHSDEETTDINYNSHSLARRRRKLRLRNELDHVVEDLDSSAFKGYVSRITTREFREYTQTEGHVFTDAEDRLICVCMDSSSPTWAGAEHVINPGEKCTFLSKCTQCEQCVVTRDTLPYLVDRHQYITIQSSIISAAEFESLYGREKVAIEAVLDLWPDPEQVEDAMIIASTEGPLLPSDLVVPELTDSFG